MSILLKPPCGYQGGKQRISNQIVDYIYQNEFISNNTKIYDLCCGSGAISLEFINRGIDPHNIIMLDCSSWGKFWKSIGENTFFINKWVEWCDKVPTDKSKIQNFMLDLSFQDANIDEPYKYLLLQSAAFGGKQIWKEGNKWKNTSFRNYWLPTENTNRKSPVNPTQPSIEELKNRVIQIAESCKGITCINDDISKIYPILEKDKSFDSIIYIDPPYLNSTKYGFYFNTEKVLSEIFNVINRPIYVSEQSPIAKEAIQIMINTKKGGINGNKNVKRQEWLNVFR